MIREMKNRGMSIKQMAEELDLNRKTVSKWLKAEKLPAYQRTGKPTKNEACARILCLFYWGEVRPELGIKASLSPSEADLELKRMAKEIREMREENEILKKAAAFFAKNQK